MTRIPKLGTDAQDTVTIHDPEIFGTASITVPLTSWRYTIRHSWRSRTVTTDIPGWRHRPIECTCRWHNRLFRIITGR